MPAPSKLTRDLIEAGLRRPTGANPLADALLAMEAANRAIHTASSFPPGPQRDQRLGDAVIHLDTAKAHLSAERIRSERAA